MAEVIQFNCPACGTMLSLPVSMSGHQGPCPNCAREIIAPDPRQGMPALEISIPAPGKEIEPFKPFGDAPAPVAEEEDARVVPATAEWVERLTPVAGRSPWTMLGACLLTACVALVWGYVLGVRSPRHFAKAVPIATPEDSRPPPAKGKPAPPSESSEPDAPGGRLPEAAPVSPEGEPGRPHEDASPMPAKASAAAETALRGFLDAPGWATRSAHVLFPEKVRSAMEAYAREVPDGPTVYKSISMKQTHVDEATGQRVYIFYVATERYPAGIPVAVRETKGGWLVDWEAFVEFRDGLFQKFVEGPTDKSGRFHLVVTHPTAERAAKTESEAFSPYILQSPLAGKQQLAFVKKASDAYGAFKAAAQDGEIFTPVLEVLKRNTREGQSYFEVTKVVATNWMPREN